jgi:hypothetical protein
LRGHWGAMKAAISVVHKRENGEASSSHAKKKRGPKVQAGAKRDLPAPPPATQPNNQRPSRGENRIALGQFRCQRHPPLQSNETLRRADALLSPTGFCRSRRRKLWTRFNRAVLQSQFASAPCECRCRHRRLA